jgi:hypothetical protein
MAVVQLRSAKDEAIRLLEKSYEDHAPFDSADLGWILSTTASTRFAAIRGSKTHHTHLFWGTTMKTDKERQEPGHRGRPGSRPGSAVDERGRGH